MENVIYEFHQVNMYCNNCLANVAAAISRLNDVKEYAVDINKKLIRVVFRRNALGKKQLKTLINQALTGSLTSELPERQLE